MNEIQAKRIFRRDFDGAEYELFFFLISVWASGPCSESWFRKQKRHAAAKEQRRKKKMEKKFDIFVELAKIFVLGLFFDHFLVYFFFPTVSFFFFFI